MKCFLLLLAFKLVSADKLDRTYLPPRGATFSGGSYDDLQAPLEYPKKSYNIIDDGQFPVTFQQSSFTGYQDKTVNYPTLNYPSELGKGASYLPQRFDSTVLTSTPSYYSFPPSTTYIDNSLSKSPNAAEPPYIIPTTNRRIGTSPEDLIAKDESGYHYNVPKLPKHKSKVNDKNTEIDNYNTQKLRFDLNSRQRNQNVTPKTAINYRPSAFGYYGGKPMIMTSQKELSNMDIPLKFGEYDGFNLEMRSFYPERNGKGSLRPFQTPLVGNSKNQKPEDSKDSKPLISSLSSQNLRTAHLELKKKMPIELQQRSGVPLEQNFSPNEQQLELDKNAVILNRKSIITPERYSYNYDTSNGIHAEECGTATDGVKARGSYSYTGDDGKVYSVTYTADENGFQPRGDHLPTPPPIPEAIKKVIEQAARDKAAGIVHDGSYDDNIYGYKNYEGAMDRYLPKNIGIPKGGQKNSAQVIYNNEYLKRPTINLRNDKQKNDNIQAKKNNAMINKSKPIEQIQTNQYLPHQAPEKDGLLSDNDNLNNQNTMTHSSRLPVVGINDLSNGVPVADKILHESMLQIKENISQKDYEPEINHKNNIQFGKPISSKVISKEDKSMTTQIPYINDISENFSQKDQRQSSQGLPTMVPTNYDSGYFYVPPVVNFQDGKPQLNKQSILNIKPEFKAGVLKNQDVNSNIKKLPELDNILEQNNKATNNLAMIKDSEHQNDSLKMVPIIVTSRREELPYYNTPNEPQSPFEKDANVINYPNAFDSSSSTTPMQPPNHNNGYHPIEGHFHQHYETTYNPADFHQTIPNIDNGFNIPLGNPRISISQDVVTSTHRPDGNEINLEINQNVKIHGVGSSTPVDFQGYPITITGSEFYSTNTNIPEEETGFNEDYLGNRLGKPAQNYSSTQDVGKVDIYTTNDPIGAFDFDSTVSYNTPNLGKTDATALDVPNSSSFTSKDFEQSLIPEDLSRTPPSIEGHYESGKVTGEDFNGPKQPQTFDPETGYHYK